MKFESLTLLLIAAVFVIDLLLPLGVASAVPYTFAVLLALKARSRRFVWWIALACGVLTFGKMWLHPDRGTTELWKVVTNRCLAIFAISMTAFLGTQRRRADDRRRRAEAQTRLHLADLAHLGRLKTAGQLATGLAHELNQPLAAVSLQSEIAKQLAEAAEPNKEALLSSLCEITEQSQRAAEIVRTLRQLVTKSEPRHVEIAVNTIVTDAVRLIESQAEDANVALDVELSDKQLEIRGDAIQLEQVLLNLLQNAIESFATTDGPRIIHIATEQPDPQHVAITVRDTGVGFAAADAERLFERFFTTKPHGMGMGLAISRSIVEAHGGRLWAAANPDRGATFTFTLPVA